MLKAYKSCDPSAARVAPHAWYRSLYLTSNQASKRRRSLSIVDPTSLRGVHPATLSPLGSWVISVLTPSTRMTSAAVFWSVGTILQGNLRVHVPSHSATSRYVVGPSIDGKRSVSCISSSLQASLMTMLLNYQGNSTGLALVKGTRLAE